MQMSGFKEQRPVFHRLLQVFTALLLAPCVVGGSQMCQQALSASLKTPFLFAVAAQCCDSLHHHACATVVPSIFQQ